LGIVVELDQTEESMLHSAKLVAFAATREDPFALVFDAGGTALRISKVAEVTMAPYTVLGWDVSDITATVRALTNNGARLERFPGIPQDELGIWTSPGGSRVAWFKDPEGNLLSVSQG
jgi:hypothetical protein